MKAKLIFDGKEFEVELSEEEAKKFGQKTKRTGYERGKYLDNFSAVVAEGTVYSDFVDDAGFGRSVDLMYENANYYTSYEVAENNARADKLMRQLRRFAVEHREANIDWQNDDQDWCTIRFDHDDARLMVDMELMPLQSFGEIYFDSEEAAQLAIDTFRDELIWYFTEYKDSL